MIRGMPGWRCWWWKGTGARRASLRNCPTRRTSRSSCTSATSSSARARAQGDPQRAWGHVRAAWPDGPATTPGEYYVVFTLPLLLLAAALALDDGDLPTARTWLDAHRRWLDFIGATLGRAEGHALEAEWHRTAGNAARA